MNKLDELFIQADHDAIFACRRDEHTCVIGSDYFLSLRTRIFGSLILKECEKKLRHQGYELMGVITDCEEEGFDDTCLETVKRVEKYLLGNQLSKDLLEESK